MEYINYMKAGITAILTVILAVLYLCGKKKEARIKRFLVILSVINALTLPFLIYSESAFLPFILTGIVFITVVYRRETGIFYTAILFLFLNIFGLVNGEEGEFILITGMLISLLSIYRKEGKQWSFSLLLLLSADILLLLKDKNFSMNGFWTYQSAMTLCSIPLSLLVGGIAGELYEKELTIEAILKEDFKLFRLLKESDKLYSHGNMVANISEKAAAAAGLDGKIARAGGLYQEIGRLKGKDYIMEGISIARKHHLPKQIINIIASHNLKADKPRSPEGAVVMLTASLVSAKEYFQANRQTEEKDASGLSKLMVKFTENLFSMRLEKDSLEESGLTVGQYISLKKFYLDYYGNQEDDLDT